MLFATKGASGKTTWPLADRDLAWDNGTAHNAIVAKATKDDGSIDQALMKSVHFWYDDSDPGKITSYKLLFCDVIGGDIKAVPRGIFACTGSHGIATADIPEGDIDGIKAKIATYYNRMAKEFDDDSIKAPWEDGGKMRRDASQRKDFNDVHQAGKAADALEDWCDLLNDLTQTMFQIFGMSDSPESDMSDCLSQFGEALMKEWLVKAIDADLGQYLNDRGYCSPTTSAYVPYSMQVGSDYGYMSRAGRPTHKAGRTISAVTQKTIEDHQQAMKDLLNQHTTASDQLATQFKSMVKDHVDAMEKKVSDLTQLWAEEGQGPAYSDDKDKSRIPRREPPRALTRDRRQPPQSTASDAIDELASMLS